VNGPAHCSACHSPRNYAGAIKKDQEYTGAEIENWFAPNITKSISSGIGSWSSEQLESFLKTGLAKNKTAAFGPMAEVIQNSLSGLTDYDLHSIAEYVMTLPSRENKKVESVEGNILAGQNLYQTNCVYCHQPGGYGIPGVFPPLVGNTILNDSNRNNFLKIVMEGLPAQKNGLPPMPGFSGRLTEKDTMDILNYLKRGL
jgi:mono/diheme cytochrome c family protein